MKTDLLTQATEVFVQGFGFTRSFTHPYLGERIGSLWVLRDAPRKKAVDYRREEWVVCRAVPVEVDRVARKTTRGLFCVCALLGAGESDLSLRASYKALGYRLKAVEPIMVHPLKKLPRVTSPATIHRVQSAEDADALAKVARARQILPEHLTPGAPLRAYVAKVDGKIVGWVRSIVCERGNWCSNMLVLPAHRRRHIGSALLAKMLQDDRAGGAKRGVLTASHAGAKLYVTLGYEQVGTLLLFSPKK